MICIPGVETDRLLEVCDIVYLQAADDYSQFFAKGYETQSIVATKCLKHYEEELEPFDMVRVHRSYMVNPRYIDTIVYGADPHLLLKHFTKVQIPVGDKYKDRLDAVLFRLLPLMETPVYRQNPPLP